MTWYNMIKVLHVILAVISIAGFVIRGMWMIQTSPMLDNPWIRIAPHINDTLLLATAIILVILTGLYPGPTMWINAKLLALVIYIVLGTIALKRGKTKTTRIMAFMGAISVFIYIVLVALSKDPLPVF